MADAKKRIILYQEKTTVDNSDYVLTDSSANGTKKYQVTRILTEAEATAQAKVDAEAAAREAADNELKDDLDDLATNQLALRLTKTVDDISVEAEKGIQIATGNIVDIEATTWCVTEMLRIPFGCYKIVSNCAVPSSVYGCVIYDISGTYIRGSKDQSDITVQDGDAYIRFTNYNANSDHSNLRVIFYINNELKNALNYLVSGALKLSPVTMTQCGGVTTANGTIASFPSNPEWTYSEYITIPAFTRRMRSNAVSRASSIGYAFYDENMAFITNSSAGNYENIDIAIKENYKYVRFTNYTTIQAEDIYVLFTGVGNYSDAESFEDAVKSGKLLTGAYTLDSVITLEEGQNLIGSECAVNVTDSGQIRMSNGCKISGFKFVGSWNPTRESGDGKTYTSYGYVPLITYQDLSDLNTDALFGQGKDPYDALIYIPNDNAYNVIVSDCRFENMDRLAVYGGGERHQEKTNPVICNNYFVDCRMGVAIYGEFIRCYANEYLRCIVGCYLFGGNSNNFGEIMKCCDCGYYFPFNATAHNELTSVETAHCGLAGIYIKYLNKALGCVINGSHFPDAPIVGENVNNLYITGSIISTWLKYDSGQHNAITCCNVRRQYLYGKTNQFDLPSDTLITLNRAMDNVQDSQVNWTT